MGKAHLVPSARREPPASTPSVRKKKPCGGRQTKRKGHHKARGHAAAATHSTARQQTRPQNNGSRAARAQFERDVVTALGTAGTGFGVRKAPDGSGRVTVSAHPEEEMARLAAQGLLRSGTVSLSVRGQVVTLPVRPATMDPAPSASVVCFFFFFSPKLCVTLGSTIRPWNHGQRPR